MAKPGNALLLTKKLLLFSNGNCTRYIKIFVKRKHVKLVSYYKNVYKKNDEDKLGHATQSIIGRI